VATIKSIGGDREYGLGGPWFAEPFVEKSYRLPIQHGKNVTVGVERVAIVLWPSSSWTTLG
jgi:hypothetical protein